MTVSYRFGRGVSPCDRVGGILPPELSFSYLSGSDTSSLKEKFPVTKS